MFGSRLEVMAREMSTILADNFAKHVKREVPATERQVLRSLVQEVIQGEGDEFVLRIRLGDDRMRSMRDVAFALEAVAQRLRAGIREHRNPSVQTVEYREDGSIKDINGNTVGGWQYWRRRRG